MIQRRKSIPVQIGNITIGGNNPVAIQSMTSTKTANIDETCKQIQELADAGSELVRLAIADQKDAKAVPFIKKQLQENGYDVPLIGDFHFIGHRLLQEYSECAESLDKYRINPGNIGAGDAWDENFESFITIAVKNKKSVRIGVNAGSLDVSVFTELLENNAKRKHPKTDREVFREALVTSALLSCKRAMKLGLPKNKIVVSIKASDVQDVVSCSEEFARKTDFCVHLGLTEAGSGDKGAVVSTAALSILLQQGIGDTIRVSVTPEKNGARIREVKLCQLILQTMGFRQFTPLVTSCPGCGRTRSTSYQALAKQVNMHVQKHSQEWKEKYPGVETMKIAVMGCVVNGPGEARNADIALILPGKLEQPEALVYVNGKISTRLKGKNIGEDFLGILDDYVRKKYMKN